MRLCSIASGSNGNCIYVGSNQTHLIIDAGISGKRVEKGLNELGMKTSELNGILISHEHSDHICGLGVISRKYGIPIYATSGTIEAILQNQKLGKIEKSLFCEISPNQDFTIGDVKISPISIQHDAAQPIAYIVKQEEKSMGVVTDLGNYDSYMVNALQGLDVLLLEANHDIRMLQAGSYPYYLKQRILSDTGHLSNELSGRLLGEILHDNFHSVILGHLSKENNYDKLAYETVRLEVTLGENPYKGDDFPIYVAGMQEVSKIIEI